MYSFPYLYIHAVRQLAHVAITHIAIATVFILWRPSRSILKVQGDLWQEKWVLESNPPTFLYMWWSCTELAKFNSTNILMHQGPNHQSFYWLTWFSTYNCQVACACACTCISPSLLIFLLLLLSLSLIHPSQVTRVSLPAVVSYLLGPLLTLPVFSPPATHPQRAVKLYSTAI